MSDIDTCPVTPDEGEEHPQMDLEEIVSVGSYLTDAPMLDSELRKKLLLMGPSVLDISGIKLSKEEAMDEFCASLVDPLLLSGHNSFSFLYCDVGDKHIERLLYSLKLKDKLHMNLSWNKLSGAAATSFGPVLNCPDISTVSTLELSGNSFSATGIHTLLSNLREGLTIQKLNLQGNNIGDLGVLHLCESMHDRGLAVHELNIEGNHITDRGVLTLCNTLLSVENCSVKSVNLSNNAVGFLGARHLASMLQSNRVLAVLDVRHSSLGDIGIGHIAGSLKENSTLKTLNVSDNDIGSAGAKVLFAALAENGGLDTLHLARSVEKLSSIGVPGGVAVGEMLKTNKSITSLDLYHGLIGAKGAAGVAEGLRENTTLKVINLGGNYIGPEATKSILSSLGDNQSSNSKYFKIRGPAEPMKFFRKKVPEWKKKRLLMQEARDAGAHSPSPNTVAIIEAVPDGSAPSDDEPVAAAAVLPSAQA